MNQKTNIKILLFLGLIHCINDTLQSVIAATYPLLKEELSINFAQIGLITLCYQVCASILQPLFGLLFDKKPSSHSLMLGMIFTSIGLICLSTVSSFHGILISVALFGIGSSIFHPEASRLAHLASNNKRSMAQSFFQVGGNLGGSLGPLLIAIIITTNGRISMLYCLVLSAIALFIMSKLQKWVVSIPDKIRTSGLKITNKNPLSNSKTIAVIMLLLLLIFSKYVYMESLRSYYTFYLIKNFGLSINQSQLALFLFLFSTALGTLTGGFIGDKIGRKKVILFSIVGAAPFALLMPYANLSITLVLSFLTGFTLSSAFPAIVVYAQELLPKKLGLVSGLFFGFAFGIAGLASAILGYYIDLYGIDNIYHFCSFMPILGIAALLLPDLDKKAK